MPGGEHIKRVNYLLVPSKSLVRPKPYKGTGMKTLYSNPDYVRKMATLRAKQLAMSPPAVPFEKPKKKKDEEEDDKDKYKSFDIKLNAEDDDSKVTRKVAVYSNGTPEEYCFW